MGTYYVISVTNRARTDLKKKQNDRWKKLIKTNTSWKSAYRIFMHIKRPIICVFISICRILMQLSVKWSSYVGNISRCFFIQFWFNSYATTYLCGRRPPKFAAVRNKTFEMLRRGYSWLETAIYISFFLLKSPQHLWTQRQWDLSYLSSDLTSSPSGLIRGHRGQPTTQFYL